MKTLISRFTSVISVSCIAAGPLFSTGCALTKDHIGITYKPAENVSKIAGAETSTVSVTAADTRAIRDRVGSKKNGYGMEMAEIISTNDVVQVVSEAIQTELVQRGFKMGSGGAQVAVDVNKCLNDFKIGFWSGTAAAELIMNVTVKKADGAIVYTRLISVTGENPGVQLASGGNARVAIERALQAGVQTLMEDPKFMEAILAGPKSVSSAQR